NKHRRPPPLLIPIIQTSTPPCRLHSGGALTPSPWRSHHP
ncbi:hypothetical protein A2U01_0084048, partial [Trifolium medium]|nr:hypothetical protein [Trifolium medium]